jgi:hypothetical protein
MQECELADDTEDIECAPEEIIRKKDDVNNIENDDTKEKEVVKNDLIEKLRKENVALDKFRMEGMNVGYVISSAIHSAKVDEISQAHRDRKDNIDCEKRHCNVSLPFPVKMLVHEGEIDDSNARDDKECTAHEKSVNPRAFDEHDESHPFIRIIFDKLGITSDIERLKDEFVEFAEIKHREKVTSCKLQAARGRGRKLQVASGKGGKLIVAR